MHILPIRYVRLMTTQKHYFSCVMFLAYFRRPIVDPIYINLILTRAFERFWLG